MNYQKLLKETMERNNITHLVVYGKTQKGEGKLISFSKEQFFNNKIAKHLYRLYKTCKDNGRMFATRNDYVYPKTSKEYSYIYLLPKGFKEIKLKFRDGSEKDTLLYLSQGGIIDVFNDNLIPKDKSVYIKKALKKGYEFIGEFCFDEDFSEGDVI